MQSSFTSYSCKSDSLIQMPYDFPICVNWYILFHHSTIISCLYLTEGIVQTSSNKRCWCLSTTYRHIDGLVQERCNSSALAMELGLSCTNQSISPRNMITYDMFYVLAKHCHGTKDKRLHKFIGSLADHGMFIIFLQYTMMMQFT